ncbi:MAG: hypothetical protein GC160_11150 [Acidobacteria bacterium]|nr:hypothetical protein [Acidobacteriota bacterium]
MTSTRHSDSKRGSGRRGGALLAVLWLAVAMTAIAFALSRTVRAELDRAALEIDSARAYYLAQGGVEAAMRRIARPRDPEKPSQGFEIGQRWMRFDFPTGVVEVEIIGESGKLDVNQATPEALASVMAAGGLDPGRAVALAARIVEYREQRRRGLIAYGLTPAELAAQTENASPDSTFRPQATSIQELEELLTLPDLTPDLFYGGFRTNDDGGLVRFRGLSESLTTRGSGVISVGYASREVLAAAGMSPNEIAAIEEIRRVRPLRPDDNGMPGLGSFSGPIRLGLGGGSTAFTLRATATLRSGAAKRTVAALVENGAVGGPDPIRIVRWRETAF